MHTIEVLYSVRITLPEQDLDLLDDDKMTAAIERSLKSMIGHYGPQVERTTKDWEIEAQKRGNRRPMFERHERCQSVQCASCFPGLARPGTRHYFDATGDDRTAEEIEAGRVIATATITKATAPTPGGVATARAARLRQERIAAAEANRIAKTQHVTSALTLEHTSESKGA